MLTRQLERLSEIDDNRISGLLKVLSLYLGEQIQEAKKILNEIHSSDLSFCFLHMDNDGRKWLFDILSPKKIGNILSAIMGGEIENILSKIDKSKFKKVIEQMESDDAADFMQTLDEKQKDEILSWITGEQKSQLIELLSYKEDTAGGIMTTDYLTVSDDITVSDARKRIRKIAKKQQIGDYYNAFVTNEDGILLGKVEIHKLVYAESRSKISSLLTPAHSVPINMDQEEVARMAMNYDDLSVPVVNDKNQLVGRITIDDLMDVVQEEAQEDLSIIAGSGEEKVTDESLLHASGQRLPWLLTGLIGGGFAAFLLHFFEDTLTRILAISFFVPLIMGMGGNAGIQASAVVVRALAMDIHTFKFFSRLIKEIRVSMLNGLVCAVILFILIYALFSVINISGSFSVLNLAVAVSISLFAVMLIASTLGMCIPYVLHKMHLDPAVAMGPFITISNDILGLGIYLLITRLVLY
jgi:magnesium transporter